MVGMGLRVGNGREVMMMVMIGMTREDGMMKLLLLPDILTLISSYLKDEIFWNANQKYEANRSEQIQTIFFGNPFSFPFLHSTLSFPSRRTYPGTAPHQPLLPLPSRCLRLRQGAAVS